MSRRSQAPSKAKKTAKKASGQTARTEAKKAAPARRPAKSAAPQAAVSKKAPPKKAAAPAKSLRKNPKAAAKSPANGVSKPAGKPAGRSPAAPAKASTVKSIETLKPKKNGSHHRPVAVKAEIELPAGYRPTEKEPFMSDLQRTYFRHKLIAWKEEILREGRSTLHNLHEDSSQHADLTDRATSETDRAIELRARDRQRKLIAKIDLAIVRIDDGTYGYCEETGEPIGLKRLDARPIATLSLEAQERHERRERVYRDDRAE
jgi:DnaK suppressor protein